MPEQAPTAHKNLQVHLELWIPTAERRPTEADCINGRVLVWNGTFAQSATPEQAAKHSHWMPQPEGPDMNKDEAAFYAFAAQAELSPGETTVARLTWNTALAHRDNAVGGLF